MNSLSLRTLEVHEMEGIEGGKPSACHALAAIGGGLAILAGVSLFFASGGTAAPITYSLIELSGGATIAAAASCL